MIHVIDVIGSYVAVACLAAMLMLLPLYLSQRRDVTRLRTWMDQAPGHPLADLAASEAMLDRAEGELEALEPAAPLATGQPGSVSAARVTSERPALERITMEREAIQPHPRWRRFANRVTQPRALALIALGAALVAVAGILASERLLETGGSSSGAAGHVNPSEVEVAVLNGSSVSGLAGKVGADVHANGFEVGTTDSAERHYDQTVVMYQRGEQAAANKVAHDLGIKPVQPIDGATRDVVNGADVTVIAGDDRAQP